METKKLTFNSSNIGLNHSFNSKTVLSLSIVTRKIIYRILTDSDIYEVIINSDNLTFINIYINYRAYLLLKIINKLLNPLISPMLILIYEIIV